MQYSTHIYIFGTVHRCMHCIIYSYFNCSICFQQATSSAQEKQAANEQEVTQLRANLRQYEQLIEEYRCCVLLVFNLSLLA